MSSDSASASPNRKHLHNARLVTQVHCIQLNLLAAQHCAYASSDLSRPVQMPVLGPVLILQQKVCMQAVYTDKAAPLRQILASAWKQCTRALTGCHSLLQTSRSSHLIDAHQTVVLTALNNQQRVKNVQDVGQMPFTEFSALYAVSPFDIVIGSLVIRIFLTSETLSSPQCLSDKIA